MKELNLTDGNQIVFIDDEDYNEVNKYRWSFNGHGITTKIEGQHTQLSHFILILHGVTDPAYVDHINRNYKDNQKSNLRTCTNQENSRNQGPTKGKKYKGVHFSKYHQAWCAQIHVDGSKIHLGYFESEELAAKFYDRAARKWFKQYAYLNFPDSK